MNLEFYANTNYPLKMSMKQKHFQRHKDSENICSQIYWRITKNIPSQEENGIHDKGTHCKEQSREKKY